MIAQQTIRLSQEGNHQVLSIPEGFELSSREVLVRKDGDKLIVEPVNKPAKRTPLSDLLAEFAKEGDVEEAFPDVDEGLLPLDDIEI